MTFDERFALPRNGHELVPVAPAGGSFWCLRCGALFLEREGTGTWEAPSQSGRSRATVEAPQCLPANDTGLGNAQSDARLMLRALTHGWRCEPVSLPDPQGTQAWRWSHQGPLGGTAISVRGPWSEGPVIDHSVRHLLLTTTA